MPASLRLELFASDLERSLALYIDTLDFAVRMRKDNYVFMQRGNIFLAVIGVPPRPRLGGTKGEREHGDEETREEEEETREDKEAYRRPPRGVEIVFEVDDLVAERDRVVGMGWTLEEDIQMQPWGLEDFRIVDPEGYCECLPPFL